MDAAMQLRVAMLHVWDEARSGVIVSPLSSALESPHD
jgi:hypothetical protein